MELPSVTCGEWIVARMGGKSQSATALKLARPASFVNECGRMFRAPQRRGDLPQSHGAKG